MSQIAGLLGQGAASVYGLLDEKQWAAVSAAATALQAVIAFTALLYVGAQLRAARKTGDLQALQELFRAITEREQALRRARDNPEDLAAAFLEFINYLELQTAALRGGLLARHSCKIVREKIIDSLALIETLPEWQRRFHQARSSATTFEHLRWFSRRHRRAIDKVGTCMMADQKAAPEDGPSASG